MSGIIARETDDEAWRVAFARFPPDRKGQLSHRLAMAVSDSSWHRQLADDAKTEGQPDTPYWLVPFENYKTFCPYLVGSHERVADYIAAYMRTGCNTLILDVPFSEEDLAHITTVLDLARDEAALHAAVWPGRGRTAVRALARIFAESAARHPHRPALVVDGATYTYAELHERAQGLAAAIRTADPDGSPLCAILGERSLWTYSGILAALLSGRCVRAPQPVVSRRADGGHAGALRRHCGGGRPSARRCARHGAGRGGGRDRSALPRDRPASALG